MLTYLTIKEDLLQLLSDWLAVYERPGKPDAQGRPTKRQDPAIWVGQPPSSVVVVKPGIECIIEPKPTTRNQELLNNQNQFTDRFQITLDLWQPEFLGLEGIEPPKLYTLTPAVKLIMQHFSRVREQAVNQADPPRKKPERSLIYIEDTCYLI